MAVNRETAIAVGKQFASVIRSAFDSEALVYLFGSYAKDMAHDRSEIYLGRMQKIWLMTEAILI